MKRHSHTTVGLTLVLLVGSGCSLTGTWKTVSVQPQDAVGKFPISMVTFDENNMTYTAPSIYQGKTVTSTGKYDWNGMRLRIMPEGKPERTYPGTLWLGKTLKLSHTEEGNKMTATLERQSIPRD